MRISRRFFCLSATSAVATASLLPKIGWARRASALPLTIVNLCTGDSVSGHFDQKFCRKLEANLVCPKTLQQGRINQGLIKIIFDMASELGVSEIKVKSAYRSARGDCTPSHEKSLHESGRAIDLEVPSDQLEKWSSVARQKGAQGVGILRSSNTLHVDVGPIKRNW